jgi:hypothetical protein
MLAAQYSHPSTTKDHFPSPWSKSGGDFATVFHPFLGIFYCDMAYNVCSHFLASQLSLSIKHPDTAILLFSYGLLFLTSLRVEKGG